MVAARAAAIPDIVSDDKEGLLFSPGEAKALAAAVLRLLDDPVLAQRLTTEAYRRVGAFTASAMARGLEKIYDEVLARG